MTATAESRREQLGARYGLRPSKALRCPRVVAGLRCRAWRDQACPCQRWRRLLDHGLMWLDRHGQHVLTGEPYKSSILDDDDERDAFREAMADLGLRVTFDPDGSAWNPPSTLLVLVTTGNQNEASNQQPHDAGERPPFLRSNTR